VLDKKPGRKWEEFGNKYKKQMQLDKREWKWLFAVKPTDDDSDKELSARGLFSYEVIKLYLRVILPVVLFASLLNIQTL
jgi:hypothetical protein